MKKEEKKLLIDLLEFDIRVWGGEKDIKDWLMVKERYEKGGIEELEKWNKKRKDYLIGVVIKFINEMEK